MEKDLLDHDRPVEEIPGSPLPDEMAPPWETPGREEKKELPPEDPLDAKRAELKEREERLAAKERRYRAQERLAHLRLPLALLDDFDFSSDEAVERTLALLEKAAAETRQSVRPGPPPASIPAVTMPKTYNERANLFQRDMMGYRAVQRASGL